jgi:very-short-patch-repair endonuclease
MVECKICNKQYKIITNQHLSKHHITSSEYLIKYPNAILVCEETRNNYKNGTIKYNLTHGSPIKGIAKNELHKIKMKNAANNRSKEHIEKLKNSYKNKIRNEKISKSKKAWWENKSIDERSKFITEKVIPKIIENEGIENYHKRLRKAGILGHDLVRKNGKTKVSNLFESQMIKIIKDKGYECIIQFEIRGYYYDSFIPEKNLIIEFDGDYWHAKSLDDCANDRLKNQWHIDRYKDKLAIEKGYNIIRIRQSEKDTIHTII